MMKDAMKVDQLHPDSYRDGKDIRVGQGVKKSSLWKILTLGQYAGRANLTQHLHGFQKC
ncbi:hypothetical protein [Algoriphagus litoralis]|uniref:hypothetical protein n=1 Tax=Algoriphagus litoralis TaxID=2202829 RepID=UPI001300BAE8|nr:hypothetical protein [Algoriphagus litoralis]